MVKKWKNESRQKIAEFKVFSIREDKNTSPTTGITHPFYVIEAGDWINVIPLTPENEIILVYQYRHAFEDITLEIPGGMVDDHEKDPMIAAERELLEETGYKAEKLIYLGSVTPNPAIINNRLHTFLALDAIKIAEQQLEGTEDIIILKERLENIPEYIKTGKIHNALVLSAFYLFEIYKKSPDSGF
jgi:8-oxo-dGTP pyrophosphatase MutT (NUDIX family)